MPKNLKVVGMNKCIGCFTCQLICAGLNHQSHSISKSAIKIKTLGGLSGKFFATFCHACKDERACMEVCPTHALTKRNGGGVVFNKDLCIGCKKCEGACIVGAVSFTKEDPYPIICKHCGACTKFCPHECIVMEESKND